jgi:hypothetical protein
MTMGALLGMFRRAAILNQLVRRRTEQEIAFTFRPWLFILQHDHPLLNSDLASPY